MDHQKIDFQSKKIEIEARAKELYENFRHQFGSVLIAKTERQANAAKAGLHNDWHTVNSQDLQDYIQNLGDINSEIEEYTWPEEIGRPKDIVGKCQQLIIEGNFQCKSQHPLPKIDFGFCEFRGEANFSSIQFNNSVNFANVIFHGETSFSDATFNDKVCFKSISALRLASFSGAIFKHPSPVIFSNASFKGYTRFNKTIFKHEAKFNKATFAQHTEFVGTEFHARAFFYYSNFEGPLTFKNITFFGAPQFYNVDFFEAVSFIDCKFCPIEKIGYWQNIDRTGFRSLKLKMAALRAQREEAMFFSLELAAERVTAHWEHGKRWPYSPAKWIISAFYGLGSQYSQSPGRAIFVFIGWNGAFSIAYLLWAYIANVFNSPNIIESTSRTIFLSDHPWLALGLQNALNPIALLSEKPLATTASGCIFLLSLIQSIGSLSILALLFLAIKSNFQKGNS